MAEGKGAADIKLRAIDDAADGLLGPLERFLAGMAAAFGAVGLVPDNTQTPAPAPIEYAAPIGAVPIPALRPDRLALTTVEIAEANEAEAEAAAGTTPNATARIDVRPATTGPLGDAFAFAVTTVPDAAAVTAMVINDPFDIEPPLPEPNPVGTGEIDVAALPIPGGGFTPMPLPEHDRACLVELAALPLEAVVLEPLNGPGACYIQTPLEVDRIGTGAFEVELLPAALIDCSVAGALSQWLEEDVQPAARSILGEWVTGIRVAASYACRGRNNDPTAPLSEHAFGNAIDIAAFRLADGTWLEVQPAGEMGEAGAAFLEAIRSDACGPFTTVLGPGVAFHDDHFHMDLATRGNRSLYCP